MCKSVLLGVIQRPKTNRKYIGIPTVVQWVKDPVMAQVAAEARVQSMAKKVPNAVGVVKKRKKKFTY